MYIHFVQRRFWIVHSIERRCKGGRAGVMFLSESEIHPASHPMGSAESFTGGKGVAA